MTTIEKENRLGNRENRYNGDDYRLYVGVEVKMEALLQQLKPDYAIKKLCG
jgi:hypothetical protein